jgi:hypothetical protein
MHVRENEDLKKHCAVAVRSKNENDCNVNTKALLCKSSQAVHL